MKKLLILGMLIISSIAQAQIFHQVATTTFSGPSGTVAAGQTLQDGWIDNAGQSYSITVGNSLTPLWNGAGNAGGWNFGTLVRPSGENRVSGQIKIRFTFSNSTYAMFRSDRSTTANNSYIIGVNFSGIIQIYSVQNGTTNFLNSSPSLNLVSGSQYDLVASCVQANSTNTTLSGAVYTTAGVQMGSTFAITTSTPSTLQNVSGAIGLYSANPVSAITTYALTSYTLSGPTSTTMSLPTSYTVTQVGSTTAPTIVTPSDNGAGGTFSPSSVTLASGTNSTSTFTYTPASSGTIVLSTTNDNTLENPASFPINVALSNAVTYRVTQPAVIYPSTPNTFTVTAPGILSSPVVVTPSDNGAGGTFSPSSVTLASGTNSAATFTYTPASSGIKTFSFTNTGILTNPTGYTIAVTNIFDVDNANLYFSKGSWDFVPIGTFGVTRKTMQSATTGAYLKFKTSATSTIQLLIDGSILAGVTGPVLAWTVDNNPKQTLQLNSSTGTVTLASSLTGATHTVKVWFGDVTQTSGVRFSTVVGTSSTNVIRIQGIVLDAGASPSAPTLLPKRLIYWGDSITQGTGAGPNGAADATAVAVNFIAPVLGAEFAQVGYGSQGWLTGGSAGAVFTDTWNNYQAGRPRDLSGYDYAFVWHGANDRGANQTTVQSTVQTWIAQARAALGSNTWLFVVVPCGGYCKAALANAVNAYQLANPTDTKTWLIDETTIVSPSGLDQYPVGSLVSPDGIHPYGSVQAAIGAAITSLVQPYLSGRPFSPTIRLRPN